MWETLPRTFINGMLALTEAKQNLTLNSLTLAFSLKRTSDVLGGELCPVLCGEMWDHPVDELQSVLLCIFWRVAAEHVGKGKCWSFSLVFRTQMAQIHLWCHEGEGAAELPLNKEGWNPRKSRERTGAEPRAPVGDTSARCSSSAYLHIEFFSLFNNLTTIQSNHEKVIVCKARKLRLQRQMPGDPNLLGVKGTSCWPRCGHLYTRSSTQLG